MIKIRFFREIEEEEKTDGPVLYHNNKVYEHFLSKKCDSNLSPYKAFDEFGTSLQNGDLFTIEYENCRRVEAYCFVDGYLIVIPDIQKSDYLNGKIIERNNNRDLESPDRMTKKESKNSISSTQNEDKEAFRRYLKIFVYPYSVLCDLNLKKDKVAVRKKEQKQWELEHPEVKKNQEKEECI